MTLRVVHLVADADGATFAAALRALEPAAGAASPAPAPLASDDAAPEPGSALEATCRASVSALARELPRTEPTGLVVAHGWALAPAGERLAARTNAALLLAAAAPGAEPAEAELADWAGHCADGLLLRASPGQTLGTTELARVYGAAIERRHARRGEAGEVPQTAARIYDLAVRAEALEPGRLEALLLRTKRVVIEKGSSPERWAATCGRSRLALLDGRHPSASSLALLALEAGALPLLLGGSGLADLRLLRAEEPELEAVLERYLGDPRALARRLLLARDAAEALKPPSATPAAPAARPLRLVLNHGGLVASELAQSLAPLGWELRPLLGGGRDPLPGADLLLVLPYGDPRGALAALRRARRVGVPSALWNVEDPRYYFDPELGPLVRAAAREATVTFSTTSQLQAEYRALGVDVHYLPNYGRGFFAHDPPLEDHARSVDVLFLGTLTPARRAFLEAYRAALGSEVELLVRDDVRDPSELGRLAASSRIGLSVGTLTDAETPAGPVRGEGLTERLFDYPLAGTPVLSDARAHLAGAFEPGQDLLVFQDLEEAVAASRALLRDPARRAALAASARRKVLARHLGRHRLLELVEVLAARVDAAPCLAAAAEAARLRLASPLPGGCT